ncbi:BH0509 family protein [Staphylococcus epidermidis]|nr:BH0509 family protein [Staphylococcus epidermidis]MCO6323950.1 BH0509 family protein [Staphylococcus epidermidis]MCO6340257.1 BH0509 family protein [Staphylococcus epidermidis]
MYGLSKEECNSLFTQTKDEVERIYINYYQE